MKTFFIALLAASIVTVVAGSIGYVVMQKNFAAVRSDLAELKNQTANAGLPAFINNAPFEQNASDQTTTTNQASTILQPNNDILKHAVFFTSSNDPTNFPDVAEPIFTKGSVPEILVLTQDSAAGNVGDILLYFPNFENFAGPNTEQIVVAKSTDGGTTWSERQTITIANKENVGGAVDPSAVQLDDGRIRIYYFGPSELPGAGITPGDQAKINNDPAKTEGDHVIYSAVSDDGINFTADPGERFAKEKLTDPEVIYHQGRWLMYYSLGQITGIASSADGLTFEDTEFSWSDGGIPGAYIDAANYVHLYGCGKGGINTTTSGDGVTFDNDTEVAITTTEATTICDPSPAKLPDGTIIMAYKKIISD